MEGGEVGKSPSVHSPSCLVNEVLVLAVIPVPDSGSRVMLTSSSYFSNVFFMFGSGNESLEDGFV